MQDERKHEDGTDPVKRTKRFEEVVSIPEPGQPSPGQLTADKVLYSTHVSAEF